MTGSSSELSTSTTPADVTADVSAIGRRGALTGLLGSVLGLVACTTNRDNGPGEATDIVTGLSPTGSTAPPNQTPPSTAPGVAAPLSGDESAKGRDPDVHVVRRLTFGPTPAEVERVRSIGVAAWLDEQLNPDDLDTSLVDEQVQAAFPELGWTAKELLDSYRADGNGAQRAVALPGAALVRNSRSPAQLHERLVEFWGDHFNAPQFSPPMVITRIVLDREVLRPHATGRFSDLLVAVAQSPAMLIYLDNVQSSIGSINENYARELLELHTVGVDGGYSEDDIVAVARLLTGWGVDRGTVEFRFAPRRHDPSTVSALGWTRPATGDPLDHGVEFLRHLARLPETAAFVCRKLAVRFVADEPADDLVAAMVDAWLANDTEIAPVIRAMVSHPRFADAPPKFNRPWDHYMQMLRAVDATVDIASPLSRRAVVGSVRDLGQAPFRWPAPDGYPDTETGWLDAGALLARWNLAGTLTDRDDSTYKTALAALTESVRGDLPDAVYERVSFALRAESLTEPERTLLSELTGWEPGRTPDDAELENVVADIAFVLLVSPGAFRR